MRLDRFGQYLNFFIIHNDIIPVKTKIVIDNSLLFVDNQDVMTKKSVRILIEVLVAVGIVAALLYWRSDSIDKVQTVDSGNRQVMGTFARVVVVGVDAKIGAECVEAAFEKIYLIDNLMSKYKPDSQISLINKNAFGEPVVVDELVFGLLEKSVAYSKKTDGAFDITVGPLVDLWKEAEDANLLPSQEALAGAKAKVGYDKLYLDRAQYSVKFAVDGMKLDLGGIAKGYAIDLAVEAAKEHGAAGVMVDLGGDIRCFGAAPKGKENWIIGLQNPVDVGGDKNIINKLKISNEAVTTSGNYRRFVVIDGSRHSHIINPAIADSADELSSVTVIASRAVDADAMATAVSVLGRIKGLELIENTADTEAILILNRPEAEIITTSGAGKYLQ